MNLTPQPSAAQDDGVSFALKVSVALSIAEGAIVAAIAALLGSSVWWLWGIVFAFVAFVILACVQIASEEGQ